MKNGSLDNFNVSARCGLTPNSANQRYTVLLDTPSALDIQAHTPGARASGLGVQCAVDDREDLLVVVGARPSRPGIGVQGLHADARKRLRHLPTVGSEMARRLATAILISPSALARTMRARRTKSSASTWYGSLLCG